MSKKAAKKKAPAKPAAKKKKAEKAESKSVEAKTEPAPVVSVEPSPQARVIARHEYSSLERRGKGFSSGELSAVGLTFVVAKSLKVPIDVRRRSVLEGNIGALKGWYKPEPKKPARAKDREEAQGREAGQEGDEEESEERVSSLLSLHPFVMEQILLRVSRILPEISSSPPKPTSHRSLRRGWRLLETFNDSFSTQVLVEQAQDSLLRGSLPSRCLWETQSPCRTRRGERSRRPSARCPERLLPSTSR